MGEGRGERGEGSERGGEEARLGLKSSWEHPAALPADGGEGSR